MENHWPQKWSQGQWIVMLSVGFSKGLIKVGEAKDWFTKQDMIERLKTGEIANEYSQEHSKGITHGCLCNFFCYFPCT